MNQGISPVPIAANREAGPNQLTANQSFLFSTWAKDHSGGTSVDPVITDNAIVGPNGAMDASSGVFNRGTGTFSRIQLTAVPAVTGLRYRFDVWLAAASSGLNISLRFGSTNGTALTLDTTWQYFYLEGSGAGAVTQPQLMVYSAITNSPASATAYMWGARVYQI